MRWVLWPFRWIWVVGGLLWLLFVESRRARGPRGVPVPGDAPVIWEPRPAAPMDSVEQERFERAFKAHVARQAEREQRATKDLRRDTWTR